MKQAAACDLNVPRETSERLEAFVEILLRWNSRINLISRQDKAVIFDRHIRDALQLIPLMPAAPEFAVDLGSGGGFPGLVLAIATGVEFHLVESDRRKATFLREAVRVTHASGTVHNLRVEDLALSPTHLLTARAFAPLTRLLELSQRLLARNAVLLLPKGKNADRELTDARAKWNMKVQKIPSKTEPGATILRLTEVTRV